MFAFEVIGYADTDVGETYCADCGTEFMDPIFAIDAESFEALTCSNCGSKYQEGEWSPYECKRIGPEESGCFGLDCTPYHCLRGWDK